MDTGSWSSANVAGKLGATMMEDFACKLFLSKNNAFANSFNDWKYPQCVGDHKKCADYRNKYGAFSAAVKGNWD